MEALKQYMQVTGMSQNELATFLGIDKGHLSRWLTGQKEPKVSSLKMISQKTGISFEKLVKDL